MLEDQKISVKVKLSFLWTAVLFCYVYGDYFSFFVPNHIDEILKGDSILGSPSSLFIASLVMAVPPLMILVSLLITPKISRVLNMVTGIIFTSMMVLIAVTSLTTWLTFYVFFAILESLITSLIVWYAWKWPKQKAKEVSLN